MWGMWKVSPVPMYINFYFFNILNPEDIYKSGAKLQLQEVGPYVFKEVHERVNITNYPNGTMSFQQKRMWYFDEERTNGTLDDIITSLNVPLVGAAYTMVDYPLLQPGFSGFLDINNIKDVFTEKKVRELLFEGYSDPLLNISQFIPDWFPIKIPPYDKFGWFYTRNESTEYDGVFNVYTGVKDINKMGILDLWDQVNQTTYYEKDCGKVNGSFGEAWPPYQEKTYISMYSADLCRSIDLEYTEEIKKGGVKFNRYAGTKKMFAIPDDNPDNWCFCPKNKCPPKSGVLDSSVCRYGTPAFVSFPHFYAADDYYIDQFTNGSLNPDKEKHEFHVDLNPRMSVPLAVRARFQINMLVQPMKLIGVLRKIKQPLYVPVLWFGVNADLTDSLLTGVWWGVNAGLVSALIVGAIAIISLVTAVILGLKLRKRRRGEKTV